MTQQRMKTRIRKRFSLHQKILFALLMQALVELSLAGSDERAARESISNHLAGRGTLLAKQGTLFAEGK